MAYRDPEEGRVRDRERVRRRTEERIARGLCSTCGKVPPEPGRRQCGACSARRRRVQQAREERRRAAGRPRYTDPEKARARSAERSRERAAERAARGLCRKCGQQPPVPGRRLCEACAETKRAYQREAYARAKASGRPCGGRDPEKRREAERRRKRKCRNEGVCDKCRERPPTEGDTVCEPCRTARRARERAAYAARRAKGLCTACGVPVADGAARCTRCAKRKAAQASPEKSNAARRRRYARRRVQRLCIDCGAPAQAAVRCEPCARQARARSGEYRGLPVWPARYTVIELATGEDHGTYDSEAEVAACLAFARLSRDEVEIVSDASPMASYASR